MLHRLLWDLGVDNPDDDQAVNNKIREVEQRFHLVMILEHFEVTKVQMTFFLFMIGTITFESATSLNFQIFVQESLILMKNLLCWESEDINSNPYSLTEIRIPIGHVDFAASIFRLFLTLNMLGQSLLTVSKIICHEKS